MPTAQKVARSFKCIRYKENIMSANSPKKAKMLISRPFENPTDPVLISKEPETIVIHASNW